MTTPAPDALASCDAQTLRETLTHRWQAGTPPSAPTVFNAQAMSLLDIVASVLVWLRDHKGYRSMSRSSATRCGWTPSASSSPTRCS